MNRIKLLAVIPALVLSVNLIAVEKQRDRIKEEQIEKQLDSINHSLVQTFQKATIAMDNGDFKLADYLYSTVVNEAPDFDPALRRLGSVNLELGFKEKATQYAEKAVEINRSAYNLYILALCYYYQEDQPNHVRESLNLLLEAENLPNGNDLEFPLTICQLALELDDVQVFRNAVNNLKKNYYDEMITHYYSAILASIDKEWIHAKDEILIAKELGLDDEYVQSFLDSGVQKRAKINQFLSLFLWIAIIWVIGLVSLYAIGKIMSNTTIRILRIRGADFGDHSQMKIKKLYKWIINIGGIYYYLSLPVILIITLLLVGGLFYFFFMVGALPIKLMLIIAIGAIITIYGMVRSLMVKTKTIDPGRELKRDEAPDLYQVVEDVAKQINTKPIDEIRITPTTDLAVYERGTWRQKLKDESQRVLILGTALIKEFDLLEFKAVLAHEYGHFSNRDTAGGEVALRVRKDMINYFYALGDAGQNVWWNVAFQFLRLYYFIFVRISHGSTRLQEVMADKISALTYGAVPFKNGLTFVIKREIGFSLYAEQEIENAQENQRGFNNLYEFTGNLDSQVDEELEKELCRDTSESDTHPSPKDRFHYISKIEKETAPYVPSFIHKMFVNWDSLTNEMTAILEKRINNN